MTSEHTVTAERVSRCYAIVRDELLSRRNGQGHWVGELSASALSTATAVMALRWMKQTGVADPSLQIEAGTRWLTKHQNADGGWGDTLKSFSNISTTMLVRAVLKTAAWVDCSVIRAADLYISRTGGLDAVVKRYGRDKTFSIPILTHCALGDLCDWDDVAPLPFELAWLPSRFYKTVRLPVVSYALPALIAIGQLRFYMRPPRNPLLRMLRRRAVAPTLRTLERIQPSSGGFLEATPLTSFVTMSLAAMGRGDHPVAQRGIEFILRSMRPDGSWPIDTNLATWVTTLSVNALCADLPARDRGPICDWLLTQQFREVHPYTNADPGGWAWTDLPGGVPDADDTPGAILALAQLGDSAPSVEAQRRAALWLVNLQNRDGGWPTFCRGWGALPFDRSAADITAHVLRALAVVHNSGSHHGALTQKIDRAIAAGFRYLRRTQRSDGSWLPLWFGNQHAPHDENPVYGTSRVLAAYRDFGRSESVEAMRARDWLRRNQHDDGGWGGADSVHASVEETSLAVEALLSIDPIDATGLRGAGWLLGRVEAETISEPSPIGFYFAKLWYFESLYPLIFAVSALRCANQAICSTSGSASCPSDPLKPPMPRAKSSP